MAVSLCHAASKIQIEKEKLSAASDTPRTHPSRENASRTWKKRKLIWTAGKPTVPTRVIHGTTKRQVSAMFAEEKPFLIPAAPGTLPLLPARPARGASRRLCRSRDRLLRPAPGLDRTLGPSAMGRTLRSHLRSQ